MHSCGKYSVVPKVDCYVVACQHICLHICFSQPILIQNPVAVHSSFIVRCVYISSSVGDPVSKARIVTVFLAPQISLVIGDISVFVTVSLYVYDFCLVQNVRPRLAVCKTKFTDWLS